VAALQTKKRARSVPGQPMSRDDRLHCAQKFAREVTVKTMEKAW
jgi:hypothetical protein